MQIKGKLLYVNLEIQPASSARKNRPAGSSQRRRTRLRPGRLESPGWVADCKTLIPRIIDRLRDQPYALVIAFVVVEMLLRNLPPGRAIRCSVGLATVQARGGSRCDSGTAK